MADRFKGFLGIWTWPILNLILEILAQRDLSSSKLENIEEIEFEDWKGRTRKIRIHREVH
jgi:hypothetical protein